mgnify:CR=1 FL=1
MSVLPLKEVNHGYCELDFETDEIGFEFDNNPPHCVSPERLKLSTSRNLTLKFQSSSNFAVCRTKFYPNQPKLRLTSTFCFAEKL